MFLKLVITPVGMNRGLTKTAEGFVVQEIESGLVLYQVQSIAF